MANRTQAREESGGELDLIRQIRRKAGATGRSTGLHLGIGDDCALIRPRDREELAITTDLSIAGRHFRLDWHPPEVIGRRTLARGLSDLAAMGARPVAAFLSLGVPKDLTVASPDETKEGGKKSWVDSFLSGLFGYAQAYGVPLAGGDLAESPVALADIVLVGAVPRGQALLRSGARAGDLVYVTGALGGSAVGLKRLADLGSASGLTRIPETERDALSAHLYPKPRIPQGMALIRRGLATSAIDLSDGLSTDLAHLCEESGVGATIQSELVPIAKGANLDQALNGGEDYELLFTARPKTRVPRSIAGVPITRIGRINERALNEPAVMIATGGVVEALEARGWQHFSEI